MSTDRRDWIKDLRAYAAIGGGARLSADECFELADRLESGNPGVAVAPPPPELLAREIVATAVRLGITRGDVPLTGPEVLLLLSDIEKAAVRAVAPPQEGT